MQGKVVLVDFWTYTCINWLRTLAYVRTWSERYANHGLVVVGVHTPEFPFERDIDNVRRAATDVRVEYPIALDSDYAIWHAFANHYWPAVYIADAEGRIRHHQFGEGGYAECEMVIQRLLREAGVEGVPDDVVAVAAGGLEVQADWTNLESPESYLGYEQGRSFGSPGRRRSTSLARTRRRTRCGSTSGRSPATGHSHVVPACSTEPTDGSRSASTPATSTSSWARAREARRFRSGCSSTASLPGRRTASTSTSRARAAVTEQRLYQLIRQRGTIADRTSRSPCRAGVEAFVFTFGSAFANDRCAFRVPCRGSRSS